MSGPSRTPPRFVPTLTVVVDDEAALAGEIPAEPEIRSEDPELWRATFTDMHPRPATNAAVVPNANAMPSSPGEQTPRADGGGFASDPAMVALDPSTRLSQAEAFRLEEQLLHRVLQRVDLSLEQQLSDTVGAAVQQQLDLMIPRLRSEVETVLRALVIEALATELSENPGSTPPGNAHPLG